MALDVARRTLPKDFAGREQAPHLTEAPRNKNPEKWMQEMNKKEMDAMKLLFASVKHQNPEKPLKQGELLQSMVAISQVGLAKLQYEQMSQFGETIKNSGAANYLGKEVAYDDSTRNFNGSPVTFNYELGYHNESAVPEGSTLESKIEILDSNGNVVFTTNGEQTKGPHKFVWDGKNTQGKTLPKGDYEIRGTAKARLPNGKADLLAFFNSHISGKVDSVKYKDGKPLLLINGKEVELERLAETKLAKESSEKEINPDDYINYIGKTVTYDLGKFAVKGGKGEISYNNTVKSPKEAKVDIYSEGGKYITTVEYKVPLAKGMGTLQLDGVKYKVPDGEYTCKITVTDKEGERVTLPTTEQLKVTGIDTANKQFSSGSNKFRLGYISSVTDPAGLEKSLYERGGDYIGKQVQFAGGNFHTQNGESSHSLAIARPEPGRRLGQAELVIYKGDEVVATVAKPENELYHQEDKKVPTYDQLNAWAKSQVKHYIRTQLRLPGVTEYAHLERGEKMAVNKYIEDRFRGGEFFKVGEDYTDKETKLRNMGLVEFEWDGILNNGARASDEDTYRFEMYTSTVDAATNGDYQRTKVPNTNSAFVTAADIVDEELRLMLSTGGSIGIKDILAVRG